MTRVSLKMKATILSAVSGALALSVIFIVILPAVEKMKELQRFINVSEEEVDSSYQKTSRLKNSVQRLSEINNFVGRLGEMASDKNSELPLITAFENLAEKNHIAQSLGAQFVPADGAAMSAGGLKSGGYYVFTLRNTGLFQNHMAYLRDLENMPLYAIVSTVSMKKYNSAGQNADAIEMNFSVKIYSKD